MSKSDQLRGIDEANAEAAFIILQDRERYGGGLMEQWAELWAARHGQPRKPVAQAERSLEDRLVAAEDKQRKKRIARRRERWKQREWRVSRKGNFYTNHHGYSIGVFQRNGQWSIGIKNRAAEEANKLSA
jgi:hypothetical protein